MLALSGGAGHLIAFDEAARIVADAAKPLGQELTRLSDAHGRVLASNVRALVNAPAENVSAMDGYAVHESDLVSLPARLRTIGKSFAGDKAAMDIAAGECARIFTGAPVSGTADRVVVQEMVRRDGDWAIFEKRPGPASHIRGRGSDFRVGDLLLSPGRVLDYRAMVALAGADLDAVEVWRRPRVAVLATGDELVDPGSAGDHQGCVPESISFGVVALARDWGAEPVARRRLPDDLRCLERNAAELAECADVVVVTGGASVGEKDHARAMFAPLGLDHLFSRVAIKPGKPVWLARAGATLVLGLPGNPAAALVTARLFLAPLLAGLGGRNPADALVWRNVPLAAALPSVADRETFIRARLRGGMAEPVSHQDSSAQRSMANSSLLLRRRPGAPPAPPGATADALDL